MTIEIPTIRRRYAVAVLAGIVLLVGVLMVPRAFSQSVDERVSDDVGYPAHCRKAGLKVVAGERETVYSCTYREETADGGKLYRSVCAAIIDGRVYGAGGDTC